MLKQFVYYRMDQSVTANRVYCDKTYEIHSSARKKETEHKKCGQRAWCRMYLQRNVTLAPFIISEITHFVASSLFCVPGLVSLQVQGFF
jgi:hypothetical protein